MIVAGIDEAGYGPLLGPLVVALAALRTDRDGDLWTALDAAVARAPGAKRRGRLPVCDSKVLYGGASAGSGLAALETTALAFATAWHGDLPATGAEFLARHAADTDAPCDAYPWYEGGLRDLELPLAAERADVMVHAARLSVAMRSAGVEISSIHVRPVLEDEFNVRAERHGTKARLLFEANVDLLQRARPHAEPIRVLCDRHGGRSHYAELLGQAFPFEPVVCVGERHDASIYRVGRGEAALDVCYATGGERLGLEVALASVFAKYTRELFMERFNRFFLARSPKVRRTAGYFTDGLRFLTDLERLGALSPGDRERLVRRR